MTKTATSKATKKWVRLDEIVFDSEKYQMRRDDTADFVKEYRGMLRDASEAAAEGTRPQWPFKDPIVVYDIKGELYCVEGFTRGEAAHKARWDEVYVEIHKGTEQKAMIAALGANATHGKARTNADKRNAVLRALEELTAAKWTPPKIAQVCNVSDQFVRNMIKRREKGQTSKAGVESALAPQPEAETSSPATKADKKPTAAQKANTASVSNGSVDPQEMRKQRASNAYTALGGIVTVSEELGFYDDIKDHLDAIQSRFQKARQSGK